MKGWGFASDKAQVRELYDWLDADKDGYVTWHDFRVTAGSEIAPMEQFYFRQDNKTGKSQPC